jgi:UDP-GlcNAc:undecaprenyl-phosphate/decaprenyl-phosphate GlcNAc-1-phosphate transferase
MTVPNEIPEIYDRYLEYAPYFGFALIVSILSTPIVGMIARRFRVLGYPPSMRDGRKSSDLRHLEKQPTPLLGGLAVLIPFVILTLANTVPSQEMTALLIAIGILGLMGVIDDIHELSAPVQLSVQLLVAILLAASVIDIPYFSSPFGGTIDLSWLTLEGSLGALSLRFLIPGDILLVAWIVLCTISVKISSGTDGLMEGNSLIAALLFFLLSVRFTYDQTAIVSIIFAGLLSGFLLFNFYPAKIWSGSSGKSTYGFILAVLSVLSGAKFATAILVLLLPITDFFFVTLGRLKEHKPKNPFHLLSISDKTHLHHKLLALGYSERRVAFIEYLVTAFLGTIAFAASGTMRASIFLAAATLIAGLIAGITWKLTRNGSSPPPPPGDEESPEAKYSY